MKNKIKLVTIITMMAIIIMGCPKSELTIDDKLLAKNNIIGTTIKNGYEHSDYYKNGYDDYINGEYIKATSSLERAIDLYEVDKNEQSELGDIQYFLARCYYFLGEYRASLSLSEQSIELNEKLGNRYIMNCMNIGDNYYQLENYEDALKYYLIAEDNYAKTDENKYYDLIEIFSSILKVYEETGNVNMILEYTQKIDNYQDKYNKNIICIYDTIVVVNNKVQLYEKLS